MLVVWSGCEAAEALSWGRVTIAHVDSLTSKNQRRRPGQHLSEAESDSAKATFLKTFAQRGNVSTSCKRAKISRETAYQWRKDDAKFHAAWEAAEQDAADSLEDHAWDMAKSGDTTMTIFLLKGLRPEKYRERTVQQHEGQVNLKHQVEYVNDWRGVPRDEHAS